MSAKGIAMLRKLLGEERAEEVRAAWSKLSPDFARLVTDFLAGEVWSRPHLDLKTRSLITLATLTALKCPQELKGHVRGALNNGCSVEEIREALLHCAVYAGVPAAIDAFRAAQEVIDTYQQPQ